MFGHIFGYHKWGEGCHWHPVGILLTSPLPHSPESSPNVCNVMVERVRSKEMFSKHLFAHPVLSFSVTLAIKRGIAAPRTALGKWRGTPFPP